MHRFLTGRQGWATVTALFSVLLAVLAAELTAVGPASATEPVAVQAQAMTPAASAAADRTERAGRTRVAGLPAAVPATAAPPAATTAASSPTAATAPPAPAAPDPASVAAPPAPADVCSGPDLIERRGQAALASLGPAAAASGFTVLFRPARSGLLGLTRLQDRVVEIYVRDCGTESWELLRHVVGHELGHAYDTARMTDAARTAYQAARGIPAGTRWYGCSGCADFATPAGDFAETYSQWLRGVPTSRSTIAAPATAAALPGLARQFFGG